MDKNRKAPILRFPGFTDDWAQRKFKDVFDGLQNNTFSRADLNYESGFVKNVHYGDVLIKFGDYIDVSTDELPFITDEAKTTKYNSSFLQDGDIIIADTAEDSTVGKCSEIVGSEGVKLLSGLHTIPCRPKEKYAPKFMGYYINSDAYHKQLVPLMQGIKVTSISKSALQDTDMILPKSFDEQAEYFSNIDNLITLHQRKCDKLVEYKKGMLQKMFPQNGASVPEIRFPGYTGDWERRKLGDEFERVNERNNGQFGITHWISVAKMYYQDPEKVQSNNLDTRTYVMRFGDIAFEGHPNGEFQFGRFVVNDIGDGIISELFPIYRHKLPYSNSYWKYAIQIERIMRPIYSKAITSSGASSNKLSEEHFLREKIPVPCLKEQEAIGNYFDILDKTISLYQSKIEKIKEYKKGLLQQMFV